MIKTTLKIDGMMCGMCESHMNDAVRNAFKVKKVTSSHSKGETVIISDEAIDENKISEVIDKTGYKLISVSSEPYEKKGLFSFGR
ncbi:MAG TPA: ATPase P [Ruminococcus sp.]|nr:ATPase P [Ruminococcus sp.]